MRDDVLERRQLMATVPNRQRPTPFCEHAAMLGQVGIGQRPGRPAFRVTDEMPNQSDHRATSQIPSHRRGRRQGRREFRQNAIMTVIDRQGQNSNPVVLQRGDHRLAGASSRRDGQADRLAFHQPNRLSMNSPVFPGRRRRSVIPIDVFTMLPRPPAARIAAQPCPVGVAGDVEPIVPSIHDSEQ